MERVAVAVGNVIRLMRADGTQQTPLVETDGFVRGIDWLAIPTTTIPGYARPKGASPMRVSLVPAYEECTAPDREHGPPLAFGSCSQPAQSSQSLTVGTADSNGQPTLSIGYVTIETLRGDPATHEDEADVLRDARHHRRATQEQSGGLHRWLEHAARGQADRQEQRLLRRRRATRRYGRRGVAGRFLRRRGSSAPRPRTRTWGRPARCPPRSRPSLPRRSWRDCAATWQLGPIKVFAVGADTGPFAVQGVFVP